MKKYIALILLVISGLSYGCTKKTCPAYSSIEKNALESYKNALGSYKV